MPKFFEFFGVLLEALGDGELHSAQEVRDTIAARMNLTASDVAEMLPSGTQSRFADRVAWAKTYLQKAGLVETPQRGNYRITSAGKAALMSGEHIDLAYLSRYKSFRDFTAQPPGNSEGSPEARDESPEEILDTAYRQVTDILAGQLMGEVMKLSPAGFERLVVRLLLNMGYGNSIDDAGRVTRLSNDEGIDGIIKEDQLGFSNIYIQAKQWQPEQTVGRPEIQTFVGALQGQQAQKGLFITTAKFSAGAVQYAENLSGVKVVLVDGAALTRLMIKHNVGVSVEHVYEIKRADSDFFSEEL
ncbi:MAG: restriction endonuclease [Synergistaceae bacterium]|nr:restriction endonuclease [Synergistaceae bacterium]MBQ7168492.1 restriction endonuclease [Synergistaceae bacterium]